MVLPLTKNKEYKIPTDKWNPVNKQPQNEQNNNLTIYETPNLIVDAILHKNPPIENNSLSSRNDDYFILSHPHFI